MRQFIFQKQKKQLQAKHGSSKKCSQLAFSIDAAEKRLLARLSHEIVLHNPIVSCIVRVQIHITRVSQLIRINSSLFEMSNIRIIFEVS